MPVRAGFPRSWVFGLAGTAAMLGTLGFVVVWMYGRRPPDCSDQRTLALVQHQLGRIFGQPTPGLVNIAMVAGGPIALRFVCTADLARQLRLPNGVAVDSIHYTSTFVPDSRVQQVTVQVRPLLAWFPVN